MMKGNIREFIVLFAAISYMVLIYLIYGYYFEDFEKIASSIANVLLIDPPLDPFPSNNHMFTTQMFGFISSVFPTFPTYGVWLCLLNFFWITGIISLLTNQSIFNAQSIFFSTPLLLIFFNSSIVHLSSTRSSILISGTAILLSYYNTSNSSWKRYAYFIMFLIGLITRIHTAAMILLLLLAFFYLQSYDLKSLTRKYLGYILMTIFLMCFFHIDRLTTNHQGKIIENKFEYAIWLKESFCPLSEMKTKKDSAIYSAIQNFFLTDSSSISVSTLYKIVKPERHFTDLFNTNQYYDVVSKCSEMFLLNKFTAIFIIVIILFSLIVNRKVFFTISVLMLLFSLLMFFLTLTVGNMYERVFTPMFSILSFGCLILLLNTETFKQFHMRHIVLTYLFILPAIIIDAKSLNEYSVEQEKNEVLYKKTISQVRDFTQTNIVVAIYPIEFLFSQKPFTKVERSTYDKVLLTDFLYLSYFNTFKKRWLVRYGFSPLDFRKLFDFFASNKDKIIVLSNEERNHLYQNYFDAVYGSKISFEKLEDSLQTSSNNFSYYKIKDCKKY